MTQLLLQFFRFAAQQSNSVVEASILLDQRPLVLLEIDDLSILKSPTKITLNPFDVTSKAY